MTQPLGDSDLSLVITGNNVKVVVRIAWEEVIYRVIIITARTAWAPTLSQVEGCPGETRAFPSAPGWALPPSFCRQGRSLAQQRRGPRGRAGRQGRRSGPGVCPRLSQRTAGGCRGAGGRPQSALTGEDESRGSFWPSVGRSAILARCHAPATPSPRICGVVF